MNIFLFFYWLKLKCDAKIDHSRQQVLIISGPDIVFGTRHAVIIHIFILIGGLRKDAEIDILRQVVAGQKLQRLLIKEVDDIDG